ncbi:TraR/DksA C4-type zinc finger protein [Rhizobium sp. YJ-22]|uniref:TraR/DksA family transcriptional regulator n=1 Tax=Rhizobium sp. YJ-22 TaxID=3037556 RepID=UPI0024127C74|nr:TraR/DksA C4-type zinc finger protein [Rhizobium sp. YJ-22]MDG3574888.1 TraR/DksA C4-type zinc finger protein [Rhizobium sp. YJ-22]
MDVRHFEDRLRARRHELEGRLDRIEHDFEQPRNPDDDDRALERNNDEVLDSLGLQGEQELRAIGAALDRIAAGSFGRCTRCGATITAARLEAVPYTPFCEACARELEDG